MAIAKLASNVPQLRLCSECICSLLDSTSPRGALRRRRDRRLDVAAGERQERRPVWLRRVSATVLPKVTSPSRKAAILRRRVNFEPQ